MAPRGRIRPGSVIRVRVRGLPYRQARQAWLQGRILVENAFGRFTGGQIVKHDGNRNTSTAKANGSVHDLRIDSNVAFPIHGFLSGALKDSFYILARISPPADHGKAIALWL